MTNTQSDSCLACGGLVLVPGITYGYAGKVCHCAETPRIRRRASERDNESAGQPPCSCAAKDARIKELEDAIGEIEIESNRGLNHLKSAKDACMEIGMIVRELKPPSTQF